MCVELAVIAEAHQAPTCVYVIQVVAERRDLCVTMSSGLVFAFHKEHALVITGENDVDLGRVQGPNPQLSSEVMKMIDQIEKNPVKYFTKPEVAELWASVALPLIKEGVDIFFGATLKQTVTQHGQCFSDTLKFVDPELLDAAELPTIGGYCISKMAANDIDNVVGAMKILAATFGNKDQDAYPVLSIGGHSVDMMCVCCLPLLWNTLRCHSPVLLLSLEAERLEAKTLVELKDAIKDTWINWIFCKKHKGKTEKRDFLQKLRFYTIWRCMGFWYDRNERKHILRRNRPRVSNFLSHRIVESLKFMIFDILGKSLHHQMILGPPDGSLDLP